MKSTFLKTIAFLGVLAVLTAVSALWANPTATKTDDKTFVCSFYPVYIAAKNVVGDVKGVTLTNLTGTQTGCVHDYQLTPENAIALDSADAVILNGAEAELFLQDALAARPNLPCIDCSEGSVELLSSNHEHHHHGDEDEHELTEEEFREATSDTFNVNSHVWTGPGRYAEQVHTLCEGLCLVDPDNAVTYRKNAATYTEKIFATADALKSAADTLPTKNVVLFHDSLAYLADELGLTVVASLSVGEDSGVPTDELVEAAEEIREAGDVIFLYDSQYADLSYDSLAKNAKRCVSLTLDCATTGDDEANAWLSAMEHNKTVLTGVTF